jgi:hypothetical protein
MLRGHLVYHVPLRLVDPTGHFEEDQLIGWYGNDWRSLFDSRWQTLLQNAEFGDVVLYGVELAAMFIQGDNGVLTAWFMSPTSGFSGRGDTSLLSVAKSDPVGLYRSKMANMEKGPSQGHYEQQWLTDTRLRDFECLMAWGKNAPGSLQLGNEWYRSPSTNQSVSVLGVFQGFNSGGPELATLTTTAIALYTARAVLKKAMTVGVSAVAGGAVAAVGGPVSAALLGYEMYSWTKWDTNFYLTSGVGLPPVIPAPEPEH